MTFIITNYNYFNFIKRPRGQRSCYLKYPRLIIPFFKKWTRKILKGIVLPK